MIHIKLNNTVNYRTDVGKLGYHYNDVLNTYKLCKTNRANRNLFVQFLYLKVPENSNNYCS